MTEFIGRPAGPPKFIGPSPPGNRLAVRRIAGGPPAGPVVAGRWRVSAAGAWPAPAVTASRYCACSLRSRSGFVPRACTRPTVSSCRATAPPSSEVTISGSRAAGITSWPALTSAVRILPSVSWLTMAAVRSPIRRAAVSRSCAPSAACPAFGPPVMTTTRALFASCATRWPCSVSSTPSAVVGTQAPSAIFRASSRAVGTSRRLPAEIRRSARPSSRPISSARARIVSSSRRYRARSAAGNSSSR